MDFALKYPIERLYLTAPSKRRSGRLANPIKFVVAHDTGNSGSTAAANVHYYERSRDVESASAHIFVDDHVVLECIPALTGIPEKAWHVLYNVPTDDHLYGANANDAAIGIEYCFGPGINADEAYQRYVWTLAYTCFRFDLDPKTRVVGHAYLDPARKTDPITGLAKSGRTYEQLLKDIVKEYNVCLGHPEETPADILFAGTAEATVNLRLRTAPSTHAETIRVVPPGTPLTLVERVNGDPVNGNSSWFKTTDGNYIWSGGVRMNERPA
jgi:hypothetical protein